MIFGVVAGFFILFCQVDATPGVPSNKKIKPNRDLSLKIVLQKWVLKIHQKIVLFALKFQDWSEKNI